MILHHPLTGEVLAPDTPHSLAGGGARFPVIDGVPFLRTGREALAARALASLDAGDRVGALMRLLADRDDHAPGPPPRPTELERLASGEVATLREAMACLGFGPVADYFAHRWSAPTFVSALGLLAEYWRPGLPVVEVGCGIGQILREAAAAGAAAVGTDLVFAKLWLARAYVLGPGPELVCADARAGLPVGLDRPTAVLCHDALYFLAEKRPAVAAMRRVAGRDGALMIGHAHNRRVDQRGVGGAPLAPDEWAALLPDATLYDDAECAAAWVEGRPARAARVASLGQAEAIALAIGRRNAAPADLGLPVAHRPLTPNPILAARADGTLGPAWPTAALADEYADTPWLDGAPPPSGAALADARAGRPTAETTALARRRVLIDLPEAW